MKKLSIIIPFYNTEAYIAKCLNSVCGKQDIAPDSYEVIVVNDGSTDGSRHIVVDLQSKYGNIILKDKPNSGQSAARNLGMEFARGKYIMFVDADDYIEEKCLGQIVQLLDEHQPDILSYRFSRVDENGSAIGNLERSSGELRRFSGHEFLKQPRLCKTVPVQYAFRASLFKEHALRFVEGMVHEDTEFIPRVLYHAKTVLHWNRVLYWALLRNDSITQSPDWFAYRVRSLVKAAIALENFANHHEMPKDVRGFWDKRIHSSIATMIGICAQLDDQNILDEQIGLLKQNNLFPFSCQKLNLGFRLYLKAKLRQAKVLFRIRKDLKQRRVSHTLTQKLPQSSLG